MAQIFTWNALSAGNFNTSANWSPSGVPSFGDKALFDGTSVQNCTIDDIADVIKGIIKDEGL